MNQVDRYRAQFLYANTAPGASFGRRSVGKAGEQFDIGAALKCRAAFMLESRRSCLTLKKILKHFHRLPGPQRYPEECVAKSTYFLNDDGRKKLQQQMRQIISMSVEEAVTVVPQMMVS